MANLWTVNTGHNLGTFQESITQTIPLPVNEVDSLTVIAGSLPGGLRIVNNNELFGTPYEVKTLDSYNFTDVDIIKIDVEGFEVPLLEGARETILSNRPWIQIEANETGNRYGRPKIEILNTLDKFGMKRIAKEWPDQIWSFQ